MMKKSPTDQKYDASYYYDAHGFDLQEDFSRFLEEARQHEMTEANKLKSSSVHPEGLKKEGSTENNKEKENGKKKPWKISSMVSWWKSEKNKKSSKLRAGPTIDSADSKGSSGKRKGHVSGPIYDKGLSGKKKQWLSSSGPLTVTSFFFKPMKREEDTEIPYVSLQQNSPQDVQNYGPLYVVT